MLASSPNAVPMSARSLASTYSSAREVRVVNQENLEDQSIAISGVPMQQSVRRSRHFGASK
jgi:hypothetical protein